MTEQNNEITNIYIQNNDENVYFPGVSMFILSVVLLHNFI